MCTVVPITVPGSNFDALARIARARCGRTLNISTKTAARGFAYHSKLLFGREFAEGAASHFFFSFAAAQANTTKLPAFGLLVSGDFDFSIITGNLNQFANYIRHDNDLLSIQLRNYFVDWGFGRIFHG